MSSETTSLANGSKAAEQELMAHLKRVLEEKNSEIIRWRDLVEGLTKENRSLHEQVRKLEELQTVYAKSILALMPPSDFTLTPAELADLEQNGVGLEGVLSYIDSLAEKKR